MKTPQRGRHGAAQHGQAERCTRRHRTTLAEALQQGLQVGPPARPGPLPMEARLRVALRRHGGDWHGGRARAEGPATMRAGTALR